MFNLKLIPFLSTKKPGPVKEGLKEGPIVLRRYVVEDSPEKMLGGMSGILEKTAYPGNPGKNLLI
jgi:hypothetical protein